MVIKPVLVVDDEPQIRRLVTTLLSGEGLRSIEAGDGDKAFSVTQGLDGEISLLLTDINLPGSVMDGIALAGAVRLQVPAIPVLFISSGLSCREKVDVAVPGSMFLEKPFDLKVLARAVHKLVTQAPEDSSQVIARRVSC